MREIHQFGYEAPSRASFARNNSHYLSAYLKVVNAYALFFPAIEIVTNASMILTLLAAHFWVGATLRIGEIFAFFAYINMFFWPLRQLAEKFNLLQSARAATERIFKLADEKVTAAGSVAESVAFDAARPPRFSYWIVYVSGRAETAGDGAALAVRAISGRFGSG